MTGALRFAAILFLSSCMMLPAANARWEQSDPRLGSAKDNPITSDLHVHYSGALSTAELLRIGFALKLPYPAALLREIGATINEGDVKMLDGNEVVELRHLHPDVRTKLAEVMDISYLKVSSFGSLEKAYRFRAPLTKNLKALPMILESLAYEYRNSGVNYAELSLGDLIDPRWSDEILRLAPQIEKSTGVKFKFLFALWRHNSVDANLQALEKVFSRSNPEIVGIDIMGEETNDIATFAPLFERLKQIKIERPGLVIQVHAGESAGRIKNLKTALEMGATRIVHGVYGLDEEVMRILATSGVPVILSPTSNLYLQNVRGYREIPVRAYIDHGVHVLPGTDGPGVFNTSMAREVGALFKAGLTDTELQQMTTWNREETESRGSRKSRPTSSCAEIFGN